jgi:hypothetical protein
MITDDILNIIGYNLKRINSRVRNIRRGGCGFFTYHIKKHLTDFGIKSQIVIIGQKENPIHIFLKLEGGYYLDSSGIYRDSKSISIAFGLKSYPDVFIEDTELEEMLDVVNWNKAFNYFFSDVNFNSISNKDFLIETINEIFEQTKLAKIC